MSADRHAAWDGLRGLAVVAVLVYHVEGHPLSGGFLGVSLFFTLSGFLITTIVMSSLERGSFDPVDFWARRFRRLLPAMLLALVLVLAFAHLAASENQKATLGWDMVSAVTDWSNWRFLAVGQEYGGQVVDPSPLLHTWSLSVEVQVYLVLPVVLWAAHRWRGRRAATVATLALTVACIAAGVLQVDRTQVWYLGTHVRAQEILIGALAALLLRSTAAERMGTVSRRLAPLALAAIVATWWFAESGDEWLPRGGLALHAIGAVIVILAAGHAGRLRSILATRPLVGLGRISYGVYLYHWPIYLWITPRRLGWEVWPTTAVRVAVTLALATASFVLVERRVLGGRGRSRATAATGLTTIALTAVLALLVAPGVDAGQKITLTDGLIAPPTSTPGGPPPSGLSSTLAPTTSARASGAVTTVIPTQPVEPTAHVTPALGPPDPAAGRPTILIVGDSAVNTFGPGAAAWASYLGAADIYSYGWLACPLTLGGEIRWNDGVVAPIPDRCDDPVARAADLERVDPDLVVIYTGLWEIVDRRLPGRDEWIHVGQPEMDAEIERQLAAFTDEHLGTDRRVLWMLQPPVRNSIYAQLPGPLPEEDPARMERLNEIIRSIASTRERVWVLDTPAVLTDLYGDPYALENRTDGFHWSPAGAERDGSWMAPLMAQVASQPLSPSP